jgi:hypothetical protein
MAKKKKYFIPPDVMSDTRLTANAKLIYGLIMLHDNKLNPCTLSNFKIGKVVGISKGSASLNIQELIKYGYLTSLIFKEIGNLRQLSRTKRTPHGQQKAQNT